MAVQFAVLASGSQANATLIRAQGSGILVDLGLGPRALAERLASVDSGWNQIAAVVLTHTHGDHVDNGTLHALARRNVVLYCHEGHRRSLGRHSGFLAVETAGLIRYYDDRPFLTPNGLRIEPLGLRHDGPTFGFRVEVKSARGKRAVGIGYMADTGSWSDAMADAMADVDVFGVEFNHDVEMQRSAPRSAALIARNLGDRGHLSNCQGAELVSAVLARSGRSALKHVVLLHLSRQCNTPDLALGTAKAALRNSGRRATIHAALQAPAFPNLWVSAARRSSVEATKHSKMSLF